MSRADELFFGGGGGGGKALAINTPLPTPAGWKTMAEIQPGDHLIGQDGSPCRVVAISEIFYDHPCYELTFDDGERIIADAGHGWVTFDANERNSIWRRSNEYREKRRNTRKKRGSGKRPDLAIRNSSIEYIYKPIPSGTLRTTEEIYKTLLGRRGNNHSIALPAAMEFQDARLLIMPYTLGAWLGDGKTKAGKIYCAEKDYEIIQRIIQDGYQVHRVPSENIGWTITGLQPLLRSIGVLGNKHIPMEYLRASKTQRFELFRGLMDTDGTCDIDGGAEFTTTLKSLADDVLELIRSLGIKSTMIVGRAMLYGKDCGEKYRIKITTNEPIFALRRKLERQPKQIRKTQLQKYITNCQPVESVPVKCVQVENESHLYLAGKGMVPTHNSDLLLGMAGEAHQNSIIFRRLFPNLRGMIERSREIYNPAGDNHSKDSYNESLHIWRLESGRMVEFASMQHEKDQDNFRGRPHDLIAFDEAPEFLESQVVFVTAWNRSIDPDQRVRVILTGNPPSPKKFDSKWIMKRFAPWLDRLHPDPAKPGELRWFATIDGKEMEFKRGDSFVEKGEMIFPRSRTFIRSLLDDNPFYANDGGRYRSVLQALPETLKQQMLYGNFYADDVPEPFQIIPTDWVLAAQQRWANAEKPAGVPLSAVGIDPSRGGDDQTALAKRYDNWFDLVTTWPGSIVKDGAIMAELARQQIESDPGYINIDVSAIGSSGYDHIKPYYKNVIPFNPAEGSNYRDKSKKLKMRNKRTEMYWRMRDALDPNDGANLMLPPGNEIVADLCSCKYIPSAQGVIAEEKEDIKKRLGRSPDVGEAIMMAHFPESGAFWTR